MKTRMSEMKKIKHNTLDVLKKNGHYERKD